MSLGDLIQAFANAAEAKQRYQLASAQLQAFVREGSASGAENLSREVIELGLRAAELEAAAEALLMPRSSIH